MVGVSVIIPVFKVEPYIERCARSLFEQTLEDMEFIFVDDCTPDASMDILRRVLKEYPARREQVVIVRHDVNRGLVEARKTGLSVAKGEYIVHCDSDDWVDCGLYKAMYETAKKEESDMVVCDYDENGEPDTMVIGCKCTKSSKFVRDMIYRNAWCIWNKMTKASVYSKLDFYPLAAMGEDMVYSVQLAYCCKKISAIHDSRYHYFRNVDSITNPRESGSLLKICSEMTLNCHQIELFLGKQPESFRTALNWIKYLNKAILFIRADEMKNTMRLTFPGIERRLLLSYDLPFKNKCRILSNIWKNLS